MSYQLELPMQPTEKEFFDQVDTPESLLVAYETELAEIISQGTGLLEARADDHADTVSGAEPEDLEAALEQSAADIKSAVEDNATAVEDLMWAAAGRAGELLPKDLRDTVMATAEEIGEEEGYDFFQFTSIIGQIQPDELRRAAQIYFDPRILRQYREHVHNPGPFGVHKPENVLESASGDLARKSMKLARDADVMSQLETAADDKDLGVLSETVKDCLDDLSGYPAERAGRALLDRSVLATAMHQSDAEADVTLQMASGDSAFIALTTVVDNRRQYVA